MSVKEGEVERNELGNHVMLDSGGHCFNEGSQQLEHRGFRHSVLQHFRRDAIDLRSIFLDGLPWVQLDHCMESSQVVIQISAEGSDLQNLTFQWAEVVRLEVKDGEKGFAHFIYPPSARLHVPAVELVSCFCFKAEAST
ncbi:hypothetical protein D3C85_1094670 [compost metagenome]